MLFADILQVAAANLSVAAPGLRTRVPAGDMQAGFDRRVPAGDMQSGSDVRKAQE